MSNTTKLVVGIVAGVAFLLMFAIGAFGVYLMEQDAKTVVTKTEVPEQVDEPKADTQVTLPSDEYEDYISGAENIFVDACVDGDPTAKSYCKCTYDWLDTHLTNDEFYDVSIEATKGGIPDVMYDAIEACI